MGQQETELSDEQLLAALERDDAYQVVRVLARKGAGATELVRLPGGDLRIRKRIPYELANVSAWTTLMEIRDPLLPRVRELYRLPDQLVVVCDYIEGMSLAELVGAVGRLEPSETVRRLRELCHAAGVLHAHDIVHRDVSPGNVVISARGTHLIDLGNARAHLEGARRDTTLLGTYGFASPEQYGFAQTDARSDIYSLGRLGVYMLTGVLPSDADFDASYLDDRLVPPALRAVIDRACAFEPSSRYQSAAELAAALLEAERTASSVAAISPGAPAAQGYDVTNAPGSQGHDNTGVPAQQGQHTAPRGPSAQAVHPIELKPVKTHETYPAARAIVPVDNKGSWEDARSSDASDRSPHAAAQRVRRRPSLKEAFGLPALLRRAWPQARAGQKAALVLGFIHFGFWIAAFINAGINPTRAPETQMQAFCYPFFGMGCALATYILASEYSHSVLRASDYGRQGDRRWRLFLWRFVFDALLTLAMLVVVGMVGNALYPQR